MMTTNLQWKKISIYWTWDVTVKIYYNLHRVQPEAICRKNHIMVFDVMFLCESQWTQLNTSLASWVQLSNLSCVFFSDMDCTYEVKKLSSEMKPRSFENGSGLYPNYDVFFFQSRDDKDVTALHSDGFNYDSEPKISIWKFP